MAIIGVLALGSFAALNAQSDFDPLSEDFFSYKAKKMAYFDSVRVARNGDMKGVGYTPFMRWVQLWQPLVINDGGLLPSLQAKNAGRQYGLRRGAVSQAETPRRPG